MAFWECLSSLRTCNDLCGSRLRVFHCPIVLERISSRGTCFVGSSRHGRWRRGNRVWWKGKARHDQTIFTGCPKFETGGSRCQTRYRISGYRDGKTKNRVDPSNVLPTSVRLFCISSLMPANCGNRSGACRWKRVSVLVHKEKKGPRGDG